MAKRTSENDSLQFFALDTTILRSVRPKIMKIGPSVLCVSVRAYTPARSRIREAAFWGGLGGAGAPPSEHHR